MRKNYPATEGCCWLGWALAPTLCTNPSFLESLQEDAVQGGAGSASDTVDAYVPRNTEGQPGTLAGAGSCTAHAHAATAIIRVLLLWHLFLIYLISIYAILFLFWVFIRCWHVFHRAKLWKEALERSNFKGKVKKKKNKSQSTGKSHSLERGDQCNSKKASGPVPRSRPVLSCLEMQVPEDLWNVLGESVKPNGENPTLWTAVFHTWI